MLDSLKKLTLGIAALAGAAVGGAAIAGAATSTSATATKPATVSPPRPPLNMPAPGSASHEDAEKTVTGADAAKAQAAAVKAAGSGTAGDVTSTYFGNGYEVTVTQSDGSSTEYHLDANFNVMTGPPGGGPGGAPAGSSVPWGAGA